MGKGDRKSRKGKIIMGSFGVRRLRKKNRAVVIKPVKEKAKEVKAEVKHEAVPEVVAAKEVKAKAAPKTPAKAKAKETAVPKEAPKAKKTKKEE